MRQEAFIDLYEILQISPNAEQETLERVYRLLAKRYHPDNHFTGDADQFDRITKAYRLLSDPEKRKEYDTNYGGERHLEWKSFSQALPSGGAETDREIYQGILAVLYVARRRDALNPGVGIVHLEKLLSCPEKTLEFHIWYLKEKGWIQRLETGGFAITAKGVDAVMEQDLLLRKDRLLPAVNEFSNQYGESMDLDHAVEVIASNPGFKAKAANSDWNGTHTPAV
jgi:curved DNA-binding protein